MTHSGAAAGAALAVLAGLPAQYQRVQAADFPKLIYNGRCVLMGYSLECQRDGYQDYGQVTSPTAGEIIASIGSLDEGIYRVKVATNLSGTVAAADFNNMVIHLAGLPPTSNIMVDESYLQPYTNPDMLLSIGQGQSLGIHAVNAGTTGAIYSALFSAIPVDAGIVRLYDATNESGLQIASSDFGPASTDSRWFGPAGILCERGLYATAAGGLVSGSIYFLPLPSL